MVSKLHDVIEELTSFRQNSPADAGVVADVKARNPSASIPVAGAAVILKNCLIFFSLSFYRGDMSGALSAPASEMGYCDAARHARMADPLSRPLLVVPVVHHRRDVCSNAARSWSRFWKLRMTKQISSTGSM
jgi:hypothetical protein